MKTASAFDAEITPVSIPDKQRTLDDIISAARQISQNVSADNFSAVFNAYITVSYNVTIVPHDVLLAV